MDKILINVKNVQIILIFLITNSAWIIVPISIFLNLESVFSVQKVVSNVQILKFVKFAMINFYLKKAFV